MYADDLLAPWSEQTMALLPSLELFDAHTHIGQNDPDGFTCTAAELLETLAPLRSRAVVFPMHEPGGYAPANDAVIATAGDSGGTLVAFCRVDPRADPVAEIRRCVEAGALGIKLHPRAERFGLLDEGVQEIVAVADELGLPILIHAGRGIPALGAHVLAYAERFPRARFILAHAGVCDLSWIWEAASEHPNVFFDTAWWSAPDQIALFSLVPPGQILWATDVPFGTPVQGVLSTFRAALQVGLTAEQLASVASGQLERILAREDTLDLGPAPSPLGTRSDPLLARAGYYLTCAYSIVLGGGSPLEFLDLARLSCKVSGRAPQAAHCAAIVELIELALGQHAGEQLHERFRQIHILVAAAAIAATPDVPVGADRP